MWPEHKSAVLITVASFIAGLFLGRADGASSVLMQANPPDSQRETGRAIRRSLTVHQLDVTSNGFPAIRWGVSAEGGPGLWMAHPNSTAAIQAGVHANGFPFLLVSDAAIRSFGLGRVDGPTASPILVFRHDNIVRMVFGLSMTENGQSPFLVHYSAGGTKTDFLGRYCDDPNRVCVH
jgi:hypothetical protein